jgi:hypothetical protein
MRKILTYFVALAVVATSAMSIAPADAVYPACGEVKGGNTTFLVCDGYTINHFWSDTNIWVRNMNDNSAELVVTREGGIESRASYYKDQPETRGVGELNGRNIELVITYLGRDNQDPNRALIKVESNATYEDSLGNTNPTPNPGQSYDFGVGVNNYPDVGDNSSINLPDSWVNMYIVELDSSNNWKLVETVRKNTGNDWNPHVTFTVEPNEIVYFFGFKSLYNATISQEDVEQNGISGTTAPPYKNFTDKTGMICQTNFTDTNSRLQSNGSDSCATSMSTPFLDYYLDPAPTPDPEPDSTIPTPYLSILNVYEQNGSKYVDLSWDDVDGDYSYYAVLEHSSDGNSYSMHSFHTNAGNNGISMEVDDNEYYRAYVLRYKNSWDNNSKSDYVYFNTVSNSQQSIPVLSVTEAFDMYSERYVTFHWNGEVTGDDRLEIERSTDSSSYNAYQNHSIYSAGSVSVLVYDNEYYKARIVRDDGNTVGYSDYVYFNTLTDSQQIYEVPVINFPAENQKVYHDKDDYFDYNHHIVEREMYTTWNEIDGADNYEVYYDKYDSSTNAWEHYGTYYPGETKDLLYSWIGTGKFRVKVRAVNGYNYSDWTDWRNFEVYNHGDKETNSGVAGSDGVYSGYKNLSVEHTPTGIIAKVVNYDHGVVYLELQNANRTLIYVKKDQSYYAWNNSTNSGLVIYYEDINDGGVYLRFETINQYPAQ